ncbi:MAG TPA: hypothetical protein VEG60_27325 [Candidatus Binatia bacterium]|nr:hypothetical protein [Candidatus Binatia bacterium]
MKTINAHTPLKLVAYFSSFVLLAVVTPSSAGDYYTYQDSAGKLVISNYAPPQGSNVIKEETLPEVTDQQIIESQLRENRLALENRLWTLEKSVSELTEHLRAQAEVIENESAGYGDTNIAVGVTQVPIIVAKPPHKKFNRRANLKRVFPNTQPRPAAPSSRCCGSKRTGSERFLPSFAR